MDVFASRAAYQIYLYTTRPCTQLIWIAESAECDSTCALQLLNGDNGSSYLNCLPGQRPLSTRSMINRYVQPNHPSAKARAMQSWAFIHQRSHLISPKALLLSLVSSLVPGFLCLAFHLSPSWQSRGHRTMANRGKLWGWQPQNHMGTQNITTMYYCMDRGSGINSAPNPSICAPRCQLM